MVTSHLLSPPLNTPSIQDLLTSQLLPQVQDTWTPSMSSPKCIKPVFLFPSNRLQMVPSNRAITVVLVEEEQMGTYIVISHIYISLVLLWLATGLSILFYLSQAGEVSCIVGNYFEEKMKGCGAASCQLTHPAPAASHTFPRAP